MRQAKQVYASMLQNRDSIVEDKINKAASQGFVGVNIQNDLIRDSFRRQLEGLGFSLSSLPESDEHEAGTTISWEPQK